MALKLDKGKGKAQKIWAALVRKLAGIGEHRWNQSFQDMSELPGG
jgi:hypothetical protein